MTTATTNSIRLGRVGALVVGALVALGGCGKVGSLDIPPGSTYPKVYPAGAIGPVGAKPQTQTAPTASFTADGAWIDPNLNRPQIDPYIDIDQKGAGGSVPAP